MLLVLDLHIIISRNRILIEWELINSSSTSLIFNFYLDSISIIFFTFVSLISGCVFLYRTSYIHGDKNFRLFIILVIIFVLRIFFIVFSLNIISIILGWDGLGVISYILVIYYKNEKSNRAGIITALSNRIGDAALILSIACILEIGRWNYILMEYSNNNLFLFIVCLAAITKRAQIPFSAWLPAAIAAPTPVRALVHSSTLVTAGVYLLIRFRVLLKGSLLTQIFIYLGIVTTIIASIRALFEVDFKKVVALSTLRQLGIIVTTLSIGFVEFAFIHLLIHAIFKALLFLCRGKIIHSIGDDQNIRKIGGMFFNLPVTGIVIILSRFALCGIPFLSGFYSKDLILENMEISDSFLLDYLIYILVVGLSSSYSFRFIFIGIVNFNNQHNRFSGNDKDWIILNSKLLLVIASLIRGSILLWIIENVPHFISLTLWLKWLAFIRIIIGFRIGVRLCFRNHKIVFFLKRLHNIEIFIIIWHIPFLSGRTLGKPLYKLRAQFKNLDYGWSEVLGGQGLYFIIFSYKSNFLKWNLSNIKRVIVVFGLSIVLYYRRIFYKSFYKYDIEAIKKVLPIFKTTT